MVNEYVKQPWVSPLGNTRANRAAGQCAPALRSPSLKNDKGTKTPYGGPSENAIVLGVNRAGSTPSNESVMAAEEEQEPWGFLINLVKMQNWTLEEEGGGHFCEMIWVKTSQISSPVGRIKC